MKNKKFSTPDEANQSVGDLFGEATLIYQVRNVTYLDTFPTCSMTSLNICELGDIFTILVMLLLL